MRLSKVIFLLPLIFLSGCLTPHYDSYQDYLAAKKLKAQTPDSFIHCSGYGCKTRQTVELSKKEWQGIEKAFRPKPKTAAQERNDIADAISRFEKIVGEKTGTDGDIWGSFAQTGPLQHDCEDESMNTTSYLSLLDQKGLLKFHNIEPSRIRGPGGGSFWLHESAVIKETETEDKYVVDSWWTDNAGKVWVVGLQEWLEGWRPPDEGEQSDDG